MAQLEKPKHGCFSSFIRVLLCVGNGTSPPVHPSDHVTEIDETEKVHSNKETLVDDAASTPGVVARLMGLDSLPKTKWVVKGTTPDSVPRSRSVNFVDYLLEFDPSHANHRRVKTSASFREVPALVQRQKGDLFVLYMDDKESEEQEAKPELRKLEMGLGELKHRKRQGSKKNKEVVRERVSVKTERNHGKNKKISKLKNEPRRVPSSKGRNHGEARDLSSVSSSSSRSCSCSCSYSGASSSSRLNSPLQNKKKKEFVEPKLRKNLRNQKSLMKNESEFSLENHSPVSVLDSTGCRFLFGTNFVDGTKTLDSRSKWEASSTLSLGDGVEDRASTNKSYAFSDINRETENYLELMLKLRTLTEHDIRESPKRVCQTESFEEICLVFEHKIFDLLLYEVINEVLELYH